jgi:glutaredoxin
MDNKGLKYRLHDVTDDNEMRKELYEKTSYTTVPITRINDSYVVGPQWGKLAELVA